jgi:hypothetical protein
VSLRDDARRPDEAHFTIKGSIQGSAFLVIFWLMQRRSLEGHPSDPIQQPFARRFVRTAPPSACRRRD